MSDLPGTSHIKENRTILENIKNLEDEESNDAEEREVPFLMGRPRLTKEQQATIFEILRCAVCLEIPKGKPTLQVKACEKGHHFCFSCHKQLKSCAICRGRLFNARNFVVEELITKMGSVLGVSKAVIPSVPEVSIVMAAGSFPCPHGCRSKLNTSETLMLTAKSMLPHLRKAHQNNLAENIRSNPYTGRLDYKITVTVSDIYCQKRTAVYSLQVGDMGLFNVIFQLTETDLKAWVETLTVAEENKEFKYRLNLRIGNREYGVHNLSVLQLSKPVDLENKLIIPKKVFAKPNEKQIGLELHVSFWRSSDLKIEPEFATPTIDADFPESPLVFPNDRKSRRNHNRNKRRQRLRIKLKAAGIALNRQTRSRRNERRSNDNNPDRIENNGGGRAVVNFDFADTVFDVNNPDDNPTCFLA